MKKNVNIVSRCKENIIECFSLYHDIALRSKFRGVKSRYAFRIITMFGSSLSPIVCMRAHVLFTLFVFVCVEWCQTHIVLCFCFVFLSLVYPMLQVSLDCPFVITSSVFSDMTITDFVIGYRFNTSSCLLSGFRL